VADRLRPRSLDVILVRRRWECAPAAPIAAAFTVDVVCAAVALRSEEARARRCSLRRRCAASVVEEVRRVERSGVAAVLTLPLLSRTARCSTLL
jgi:hypothetical protein